MSEYPTHRLFLVRHGQTEWSVSGKHTGTTDIPLTDPGRETARELRPRLEGREFATVLSSPMSRARETCDLAGFGDRAELTEDLLEWNYGDYEGRKTVDIRKERPGWTLWDDSAPNGETADEVGARVDRVIERIRAADGDAIVFAHGHLLRVLTARWLGLDPRMGRLLWLTTGTLCVLGYEREIAVLKLWNDGADI
jgi:probable phosphoglycerate mutase